MFSRRGVALPLALFSLILIAALVAGGFTAALLEQRLGRNGLYVVQARGAADAGAAAVIGDWAARGLDGLTPGDSAVLPRIGLPSRSGYAATVIRLNGRLFLVRVVGSRTDAGGGMLARGEVSLLARLADSVIPGSPPVGLLANRAWTGWP